MFCGRVDAHVPRVLFFSENCWTENLRSSERLTDLRSEVQSQQQGPLRAPCPGCSRRRFSPHSWPHPATPTQAPWLGANARVAQGAPQATEHQVCATHQVWESCMPSCKLPAAWPRPIAWLADSLGAWPALAPGREGSSRCATFRHGPDRPWQPPASN